MKDTILDNRYQLQEQIGQGGFATVWRAEDKKLGRVVATKLLDPHLVQKQGDSLIKQFFHEGQAMARLSHPHIAQIYDWGQQGSHLYLVMEYLPGGDLAQHRQQQGTFTLAETLAILTPIADALETAHKQNLIHRDVKPQNILFAADGRPIITDFGLVKFLSQSLYISQYSQSKILGTPEYMAPEQAQGQPPTPQTDVYALAVVAYELLTGHVPFRGDTPFSTGILALTAPRTTLSWPPNFPPTAATTLQQALAITPSDRPATPSALLQALRASGLAGQPVSGSASQQVSQQTSQPTNKQTNKLTPPPPNTPLPYIVTDDTPLAFNWCWVPGGVFKMGSNKGDSDEKPIHEVMVDDFWLSRYPVTNAQYRLFIEQNGYSTEKYWTAAGWAWRQENKITQPGYWTDKKWNGATLPVVEVSWYEAYAFTQWASSFTGWGIALPTEAEWEKGARGTDERPYPWGSATPSAELCNFNGQVGGTTPVGRYSPQGDSPYGAADMAGNVWEWVLSRRNPYPYRPRDGRDDPTGNSSRGLRGGSWVDSQDHVRAAYRINSTANDRSNYVGFRLVCGRVPHL
jgi:serine/threonine protein kinase